MSNYIQESMATLKREGFYASQLKYGLPITWHAMAALGWDEYHKANISKPYKETLRAFIASIREVSHG